MTKWGWMDNHTGKCQDKVFDSPNEAIEAMRKRMSDDAPDLVRLHEVGFSLVLIEVTMKPIMVMEVCNGDNG